MAPEGLAPLAPILAPPPSPAWVGPENEKTPRGCERSARGSGARCPPAWGSFHASAATADRRAAADNHRGSRHAGSLAQVAAPRGGDLTIRAGCPVSVRSPRRRRPSPPGRGRCRGSRAS
ncbi:hypothetical protein GT043_14385 [Streptomyces sp. SID2131]|nr:hypothetical protein [Streptomyces sp. SID2131]